MAVKTKKKSPGVGEMMNNAPAQRDGMQKSKDDGAHHERCFTLK